jgi:hypothetical protein
MTANAETGEMEPIISPGNTGGMYDFAVMTPEAQFEGDALSD